jgi:hypothetical protein
MIRCGAIVGACAVTLAAACGGSNLTQPSGPNLPIVRLSSQPYSFAYSSGLDRPARVVVRDAATWQALWNRIYLRQSPVPPPASQ